MAFFAGKSGRILIQPTAGSSSPTVRALTDWSCDVKTNLLDVTNFTSGGYEESTPGTFSAEISASGPYDGFTMNNATGVASNVVQGTLVQFVLDVNDGTTIPTAFSLNAYITSVKIDTSVKDVVKVSYSATASGAYTAAP